MHFHGHREPLPLLCPGCGADNEAACCSNPETGCGETVCACDCAGCNPQTCRKCGDDLWGPYGLLPEDVFEHLRDVGEPGGRPADA